MHNPDLLIYAVHVAFWALFILTRLVLRSLDREQDGISGSEPISRQEKTAPFSRALLAFHGVAFVVMFIGLGRTVIPGRVPYWFAGQRLVAVIVIAAGAVLMSSALVYFRSWRVRAKLDEGHQLATGGPFRIIRNPIYMGMNLLALGTAIWDPTWLVWIGFVLMAIGSDLRARAEETILEEAFGAPYREYRARTRRFLPGVY